jgi:glyoxylase-like metal-dependent hydrolase (beta-lactamase superfamily II)
MELTPFHFTEILPDLFVYRGAVNTGILKWGHRAILIDCDETLTPSRLEEVGITTVERIYCTQHRRPNTAGIPAFHAHLYVPQGERRQFEEATAYWQDWHNRWHLYHFRPGSQAPLQSIPVWGTVSEGDQIEWGPFLIRVLDTPGMTDGAVSYIVELCQDQTTPRAVVFSGDTLYAAGRVWDVHSLQKANGGFSDYHGFLGAAPMLIASLKKLAGTTADCLIPSHGEIITGTAAAAQLTAQRLGQLYRNYASVSALNFYFPFIFQDLQEDPWRMAPAQLSDFPAFILPVTATSFAIRSETGALFLIDCGNGTVLETLALWKEQGRYTQLEGCWVTHYHDDHVDALHQLAASTSIPIYADRHFVDILEHPSRFFLPCLSPAAAPVSHATEDGETWHWHEFELTAMHFPGQSFYHGGLLLRGHGMTVLFCGDSFAPTGMDDYTAGNRNFIGAGQGFRRCIDLLRQHRPDLIINQHQLQAFHFTGEQLDYMEHMLIARETLLAELLPWDHPNFGIDEDWLRAYPYEVEVCAGNSCIIEVRATNHTARPVELTVDPVLPPAWTSCCHPPVPSSGGETSDEWIVSARMSITISPETASGLYPVAFRVTWDGRYLGQVCHVLVRVW